jgi:hypothetical protein
VTPPPFPRPQAATAALAAAGRGLSEAGALLLDLAVDESAERCVAVVRQLKGITATYRMTSKGPPTRHSHYVTGGPGRQPARHPPQQPPAGLPPRPRATPPPGLTAHCPPAPAPAGALAPLRTFLDADKVRRLSEPARQRLARGVAELVCARYQQLAEDLLTAVRKTESSLKRLKRNRPGEADGGAGARRPRAAAGPGRGAAWLAVLPRCCKGATAAGCQPEPCPHRTAPHLTRPSPAADGAAMSDSDKITLQLHLDVLEFGRQLERFGLAGDALPAYGRLLESVAPAEGQAAGLPGSE